MAIYLFAISIVFTMFVARRKKIRVLSPYGIFIVFQVLYNLMPWVVASSGVTSTLLSLLSETRFIDIQLVLSAIANMCFGLVYLFFYRPVPFSEPPRTISPNARKNYLLCAFPLFLVLCLLCHQYGWHQLTHAGIETGEAIESLGGMFTVTAYFKFFFVSVYLYYLYRFGLDKGAWILLSEHVLVLIIDGARATFVPVFLVTLFILIDKISNPRKLKAIYILALGGFLLSMLTRALVFENSSLLQGVVVPVTVEGTMGDYSSLQSIQGMEQLPNPHYTLGANYLLDPIFWLVPRAIGREGLLFFDRWTAGLAPILSDRFAPMGGFYYVSEAVAAFSYVGPPIVTLLFAFSLIWVDQHKNMYRILYFAWMPTIGLMFVKVPFANGFKLFLVQFLGMCLLKAMGRYKIVLPRKPMTSIASPRREVLP
ncbi:hypothetical protein [Terriglobus sp. RCC_193]|uniref:hypothetical protein n=1 Tax=Terriglobus sp. RCC_193 TaxID=3239218 RepID=UPI0035253855